MKMLSASDTKELLIGKRKIAIIGVLYFPDELRFMDLKLALNEVAPKMLPKDLKDLEMNQLVVRTVLDSRSVNVEYDLTDQGKS